MGYIVTGSVVFLVWDNFKADCHSSLNALVLYGVSPCLVSTHLPRRWDRRHLVLGLCMWNCKPCHASLQTAGLCSLLVALRRLKTSEI